MNEFMSFKESEKKSVIQVIKLGFTLNAPSEEGSVRAEIDPRKAGS